MNEAMIFERDREYFKAKRGQQLSDAAKIALLVAQNVQQFRSNRLAENLHAEACKSNETLGDIADTLAEVAELQRTHLELVQRERVLKEILYQFEKYLNEACSINDPVAAGFGIRRILALIDREGHSFSTADLSEIADKRHFDAIITKAKQQLLELPTEQLQQLSDFESLLAIYIERRRRPIDVSALMPLKEYPEIPDSLRELPPWTEKATDPTQKLNTEPTQGCAVGCAGTLIVIGFISLQVVLVPLLNKWSGQVDVLQGRPSIVDILLAVVPILVGSYMLAGVYLRKRNARIASQNQQLAEQQAADARRRAYEKNQKVRKDARRAWMLEMKSIKQQIDAENARIKQQRLEAKRLHEATMDEMRSLINSFIAQHPMIRKFMTEL